MLWIRNDLLRIRIQLRIFLVLEDPDPCGSGSNHCYLSIFGNCKQNHLQFNHKEDFAILYFILQSYSTQSPEFTEKLHFFLSALSYLAGSGSGTIIPDPDPGKSSESMRIRIHNTVKNTTKYNFRKTTNEH